MLTARQARDLKSVLQKQAIEVDVYKILVDIAEKAIEPNGRDYVYADLDYVDARVELVVSKLVELGYKVEVEKYLDDSQSWLIVRF